MEGLGEQSLIMFGPVVDGHFLPGNPADLYEMGAINDAVSIIGTNADEGMLTLMMAFPNNVDEAPFINSTSYDELSPMCISMISTEPIVSKAIKLMYRDATCKDAPDCNYLECLSQVCGDLMFVCSVDKTARAFTEAGRKVYRYHMTHIPTTSIFGRTWTKSNHGEDMLFVFGIPLLPPDEYEFTQDEARMSLQTIKYWSNLAKTG